MLLFLGLYIKFKKFCKYSHWNTNINRNFYLLEKFLTSKLCFQYFKSEFLLNYSRGIPEQERLTFCKIKHLKIELLENWVLFNVNWLVFERRRLIKIIEHPLKRKLFKQWADRRICGLIPILCLRLPRKRVRYM